MQLSQEELAERAGISTRAVSNIETGVNVPRAITISLLAEALELAADEREGLRGAARRGSAKAGVPSGVPGLPPGPARLIGRSAEFAAARAILEDGARLLTFVGGPGVGKTSLALHFGGEIAANFDDVRYVDLAAMLDPAFVPDAIALRVGVRSAPGESVVEALAERYTDRRLLLVLDTFETVAPAAAFVAALLASAAGVTVVVTSRIPLRIAQEHEFHVGPLSLALPNLAAAGDIARIASVELLAERVRAVNPRFAVTAQNASSVAQLTRLLDGVPLAIELAAPLLRIMSPQALVARFERRLPLLVGQRSDLPARQRTMHAAIAWSYERLDAAAQMLFARLAFFRGSCSLAAAAAVDAVDGDPDPLATLRRIAVLVDQSLAHVVESDDDEPRYGYLDLVREFADERLREAGEFDATAARFATYALELGRTVTLRNVASHARANVERIMRESVNCDVLRDWTLATGQIELGLQLAAALFPAWCLAKNVTGALAWLEPHIAVAQAGAPVSVGILAQAYFECANFHDWKCDFEQADSVGLKALAMKRELGDDASIPALLTGLGGRAFMRGEPERGLPLVLEALEMRRRANYPHGVAATLFQVGQCVAFGLGDFDGAVVYLDESLAIYRELGSDNGMSLCLGALAAVARYQGAFDRAAAFALEAVRIGRECGFPSQVAYSSLILGLTAIGQRRFDEAERRLSDALAVHVVTREVALPDTLRGLAEIALRRGEPREAARLLGADAAMRERLRIRMMHVDVPVYDALVASIRDALGEQLFDAERKVGQSQPLRESVARYLTATQAG
jgi:predicted ATPase